MLADYRTLVTDLVRDDASRISQAQQDEAIDAAVKRYSKDRPQEKAEDVTPDNANQLPLPAAWEADFSDLRSLEHPIGNVPPTLIAQDRWRYYRSPAALKIQLDDAVTVAAASVRSLYTIKHVVSAVAD
ncbi:MAG: hypothetical protein ACT4P3_09505, partial [Betaproteobacteria bacterium]